MRRLSSLILAATCIGGSMVGGACVELSGLSGDAKNATDGGIDAVTPPGIVVKPAALDFGPAGCGTQVPPQSVTLENQGTTPLRYEASLPEASGFALGGQRETVVSGDILPQGLTVLTINVVGVRTLGPLTTKLTVKWGERIAEVPISVKGLGGKLEADPKIVDFGDVYYQAAATADVTLRNTGTEALTITGPEKLDADFAFDKTTTLPLTIPKDGSAVVKVTQVPGAIQSAQNKVDVAIVTGGTPVCGDTTTLSLRGRRVDADLTINPGTVDFGRQGCNTTPAPRQFTVSNYAPAPVIATPAAPGARYALSPSGTTTIPASSGGVPGTATFTITAKPLGLPVGDVNENIDLDFGAPKGVKSIVAHVLVSGVVLAITPNYLSFNPGATKAFVVANKGNINALTKYTSSSPYFMVSSGETIFPGGSSNMAVTYLPPDSNSYAGTVTTTLEPASALCTPAPIVTVETK